MEKESVFEELLAVNVDEYLAKKDAGNKELSYLSWTYAWAEIKKRYADATYKIWKDEKGLPYAYDQNTGYMVYVTLYAGGQEFPCFLPVMDEYNNAMKAVAYEGIRYNGKRPEKYEIRPATMFDINKTIMRCLVKACAFAGLGLYVFAGEDINNFAPSKTAINKKDGNKKSTQLSDVIDGSDETNPVYFVDDEDDGVDVEEEPSPLEQHRASTKARYEALGIKLKNIMRYFPSRNSFDDLSEEELVAIDQMCDNYEKSKT